MQKNYLCVTFGRPTPPEGVLGGYLLKDADRGIVKIVGEKLPGAKQVETQYETLAVSGRLALLKVRLIDRAHPSDPRPHGQHRLPYPGRQQVRQQCR